ncbi:MAG TPA: DUF4846 domain-containing protein [Planctomycetota bacterium]|nr:DUF4846 domain-containing protein [Planctomycetota bacterium]
MLGQVAAAGEARKYPWAAAYDAAQALAARIPPPKGAERVALAAGSFADWLRHLPLRPGRPDVLLFNGQKKANQGAHVAVVALDVGSRDLQQCADAVIRLRAEYLFSLGRTGDIAFTFTSGDRAEWAKWAEGHRPRVSGSQVRWARTAARDASYQSFRRYLDTVFTYAGTLSLSRELRAVAKPEEMQAGDVFIQGGSPGHAVLVVDVAADARAGKTFFLLAQSYMPAQEMHVLKNPSDAALSPWYALDFGETLVTPEWRFPRSSLKRF